MTEATQIDPIGSYPFYPYGQFTGAVPSVPEFYWNAVSDEQRWKALCINMSKLADYANEIADAYNQVISKLNTLGAVPSGSATIATVTANSTASVQIPYPSHEGTGTPRIALAVENAQGVNLTATVTSRGEDSFTVQIINNSNTTASNVTITFVAIWEA